MKMYALRSKKTGNIAVAKHVKCDFLGIRTFISATDYSEEIFVTQNLTFARSICEKYKEKIQLGYSVVCYDEDLEVVELCVKE